MKAKELREKLQAALAGLDGDTGWVRRLVYELHHHACESDTLLEHTRAELAALNQAVAREKHTIAELTASLDALRQKAAGAALARERVEAALENSRRPRTVDLRRAWEGWCQARRARVPGFHTEMLARLRAGLDRLFGVAGGTFDKDNVSDEEVMILLHAGFSEYHLLSTLSGDPNAFLFEATNPVGG